MHKSTIEWLRLYNKEVGRYRVPRTDAEIADLKACHLHLLSLALKHNDTARMRSVYKGRGGRQYSTEYKGLLGADARIFMQRAERISALLVGHHANMSDGVATYADALAVWRRAQAEPIAPGLAERAAAIIERVAAEAPTTARQAKIDAGRVEFLRKIAQAPLASVDNGSGGP